MTNFIGPSWDYLNLNFSFVNFSMPEGAYEFEDTGEEQLNASSQSVENIVVSVLFGIFALTGIATNTTALTFLFKKRKKLSVTDIYLISHFFSNTLFLLVFVPFVAIYYGFSDWIFGEFLCKLVNYGMTLCLAASLLAITVASLHNTLGYGHRKSHKSILRHNRTAKVTTAVVIVVSAIALIPRVFLYSVVTLWDIVDEVRYCSRNHDSKLYRRLDTCVTFLALFFAPLLVQTACHIRTFKDFKKIALNGQNISKRLNVAKVLAGISIAVLIGWLPTHIVHFTEDFASDNDGSAILFKHRGVVAYGFSYASMSVTPLVFYIFQRRLRIQDSHTVSSNDEGLIIRSTFPTACIDIENSLLSESKEQCRMSTTAL